VITGFNTDIEHDGVVYHVQTEDKGLDAPIILSLVYVGGTILASKRSPYVDLIEQGFSDEVLAERLKRQHKLICAAINSGRINDLKKMGARAKEAPEKVVEEPVSEIVVETDVVEEVEVESAPPVIEEFEFDYEMTQQWTPPPPKEETETVEEEQFEAPADEESAWAAVDEDQLAEETPEEVLPDGLNITMLDDEEFYAAQSYTLRVLITNRAKGEDNPMANAAVSIKILGTTFRPLIYTLKTESDGVATVSTQIPEFSSGRAAVLVRAVVKDQAAELRRIIHPA
jgi:hypothetical protein